jgi:hypothetical protein
MSFTIVTAIINYWLKIYYYNIGWFKMIVAKYGNYVRTFMWQKKALQPFLQGHYKWLSHRSGRWKPTQIEDVPLASQC